MYYFTTYFDKNYLSRGLVLYDSLKEYCSGFKLYILCLDEETLQYFQSRPDSFPEITILSMDEIENSDHELYSCKNNRSKIEYYFTLSPCLPLYVVKKYSLPHICSLDADILFLSSPDSIFNYLDNYSIVITPHKFSKELFGKTIYGKFNVSFQIFNNDDTGIRCLERWRSQCIEWCGDHYDEQNDRFADQKYLDDWPSLYSDKIKILDDNICGLAPWNLNNFILTKRTGNFYSGNRRMVFYHFHHFKILSKNWACNGFDEYQVRNQAGIDKLYLFYWKQLLKYNKEFLSFKDNSSRYGSDENKWNKIEKENSVYFNLRLLKIYQVKFSELSSLIKRFLRKFDI